MKIACECFFFAPHYEIKQRLVPQGSVATRSAFSSRDGTVRLPAVPHYLPSFPLVKNTTNGDFTQWVAQLPRFSETRKWKRILTKQWQDHRANRPGEHVSRKDHEDRKHQCMNV